MAVREIELYNDIADWLRRYLNDRFSSSVRHIIVMDTHDIYLNDAINRMVRMININNKNNKKYIRFPHSEYVTWYIKADISGLIFTRDDKVVTLIVEVKNENLTLDHLAQLTGYVMVVRPEIAFLISSNGLSRQLRTLLIEYNRLDLLKYKDRNNRDRKIIIGHWDISRKDLLPVLYGKLPWLDEIYI